MKQSHIHEAVDLGKEDQWWRRKELFAHVQHFLLPPFVTKEDFFDV